MNILGIDPGKNGAIVVYDSVDKTISKITIPLIGKILDLNELARMLKMYDRCNSHIFIEDVHALYGSAAGATFTFGFVCGAIQGIICTLQIPYTLVQPKAWQKVIYQGIPEQRKPPKKLSKKELAIKAAGGKVRKPKDIGSIDTKAMSLIAAKRLFPDIDLRKNERCKVPHDGIVDALLIMEYGRRLMHG